MEQPAHEESSESGGASCSELRGWMELRSSSVSHQRLTEEQQRSNTAMKQHSGTGRCARKSENTTRPEETAQFDGC
ncbi:Hypothetical predicted protein [Xyrichtys novacula]|uniref:Uncharacterized protein n=1 Tax=Xyrichtys novacula TaxID=13765 RepID=A0AAV1FBV6_XYRNO|nr:Hypothetical predicted protein [Xyrichtys novacula]